MRRTGSGSSAARLAGAVVVVLAGSLGLAACAQVPREGPVVQVQDRPQPPTPESQYNHPKGPQPGDSSTDIVDGFLVAMTATPLQPNIAREFLSTQAQEQWEPQRVITYRDRTQAQSQRTTGNQGSPDNQGGSPAGDSVMVRLRGADVVGTRDQWLGTLPRAQRRLDFPMVRENDQWRIAEVPDALIVPRTFFDQEYQDAEIYFFDPSGRILVPEPVHVPQGTQFASALVRSLARGPSPWLTDVAHSYLPPGLSLVVSVPVSANGVADVVLKGPDPGPLSRKTTQLILAQMSWTLRQDPAISSFRLTIAGHQITDASGAQSFRVTEQTDDPHDPAVSRASSQFYALRRGRLVSGQIDQPTSVGGPFGQERTGIGPFAVSLDNTEAAGVTTSQLLVGSVSVAGPATPVMSGPGLLRPAWDFARRLWEVQNLPSGATVSWIRNQKVHQIRVPGITGADVRRFLVSRDGSRIVAVIRGRRLDRIVVSRVRYDASGSPESGTRARRIPWVSSGSHRIRDIGWSSPTTLEVLDQLSHTQAEARILDVDGSTTADEAPTTTIPGRAIGLATSPVGGPQTPYAVLPHSLYDLAQVDSTPPSLAMIPTPGLRHITYAG